MAIQGGIKFFQKSKCLLQDGTTITASSGDASADRCLDRNPISYWRSVASDDTITETLEIFLTEAMTIDRLFLQDHNFKDYSIQYYDGAAYQSFTNVVGIGGSLGGGIVETTYSRDTSYYEFSSVSAERIKVTINKTQTANDQKYITQVIVTEEMGTLEGYPQIKSTELSRNEKVDKTLSGKVLVTKSTDLFKVQLDFKDYPPSLSDDIDLIFSLQDLESTFLIWLCGGREGSPYFRKQMKGYRLKDLQSVQLTGGLKPIYSDNVYNNSVNFSASFQEAVD